MKLAARLLKKYIERTGITQVEFARKISCSETYLSHLLSGKRESPSIKIALLIETATNREVKVAYWGVEDV